MQADSGTSRAVYPAYTRGDVGETLVGGQPGVSVAAEGEVLAAVDRDPRVLRRVEDEPAAALADRGERAELGGVAMERHACRFGGRGSRARGTKQIGGSYYPIPAGRHCAAPREPLIRHWSGVR